MIAVSVIIPVCNGEGHVGDAVRSALEQDPAPAEVIVVNDGSTDGTASELAAFGPRIRVIEQANAGVSEARNRGASVAAGEWLLFLDADDVLLPGAIGALAAGARPGTDVVFGRVIEQVGGRDVERGNRDCAGAPPQGARGNFWKAAIVTPGAAIVRGALHHRVGGFLLPQLGEDRNYWMRCGMYARFDPVLVPVLRKRTRPTSASQDRRAGLVNGLRSQFHFLAWCADRGLDTSGLGVRDPDLIERALAKSRRYACWPAYRDVLVEAASRRIDSPAIRRARRWARILPWRDAAGRGVSAVVARLRGGAS